ncbi:hypothetical protein BGX34_002041 [Mortierella sp. NVP85]|nr:hypothetical protein BGX34_002041 [Mortierella sp. NVP85]
MPLSKIGRIGRFEVELRVSSKEPRWNEVEFVISLESRSVISSKGIFIGVDNTDPNASGTAIYRDPRNHATAAASAIGFSSKQSNFRPKEQGLDATHRNYETFLEKTARFPGFEVMRRETRYLELTGDLEQFKEEILANYIPTLGKVEVVASAFVEQIPESAEPESSGDWTLVLVTIYGHESNRVFVDISSIDIEVSVNGDGSVSLQKQTARMTQHIVQVISHFFIANADMLSHRLPTENIETFKDEFTTPNSRGHSQLLKDWLFGSNYACKSESPLVHRLVAILAHGQLIVSSKAIFSGVDNSDPNASGPATFRDPRNHATAAASIIELVSKQTDFKLKEQGLDATAWEYQAFFQRLTWL